MRGNFDTTARIAARQHGRVAWSQLVAAGIDRHVIQRWLRDGLLHRQHDGVYAFGHCASSVVGDYMAAVLACGRGACLSHRAAGFLTRVLRGRPPAAEVTVPTTAGRRRPAIVIHRVAALDPADVTIIDGIPTTTVPRILLDLAPRTPPSQLVRACHEAWVHHRVTPQMVEACVARNPTKKGIAKLRRALGSDVTLSDLEDAFLALLDAHALPRPRTNIDHKGDKVDCRWPELNVTIELVSFRFHATRRAFEEDVARRRRSGHIAYSYGDVVERGAQTATELSAALASHRAD